MLLVHWKIFICNIFVFRYGVSFVVCCFAWICGGGDDLWQRQPPLPVPAFRPRIEYVIGMLQKLKLKRVRWFRVDKYRLGQVDSLVLSSLDSNNTLCVHREKTTGVFYTALCSGDL